MFAAIRCVVCGEMHMPKRGVRGGVYYICPFDGKKHYVKNQKGGENMTKVKIKTHKGKVGYVDFVGHAYVIDGKRFKKLPKGWSRQ